MAHVMHKTLQEEQKKDKKSIQISRQGLEAHSAARTHSPNVRVNELMQQPNPGPDGLTEA